MQMSWFVYLNTKLKDFVYALIWYHLCQFMLNTDWDMSNLLCTVKIQFVLWVAMETVRFHIAQMSFFLKTFLI